MEQLALTARLKPGAEPRAAELIAQGPPFDVSESGLQRHAVFLSAGEVLFVFEGHEVEWIVDGLVDEPFHWPLLAAMDEWRPLLEDHPRIARCLYSWTAGGGAAAGNPQLPKSAPFHG
jgi:hypothetical protein